MLLAAKCRIAQLPSRATWSTPGRRGTLAPSPSLRAPRSASRPLPALKGEEYRGIGSMEVTPLADLKYYSHDFDWDEHAAASASILAGQVSASEAHWDDEGPGGIEAAVEAAQQAASWERFHDELHSSARVYKERRYLLKEFPELQHAERVVELGCGNGSSVLAVLRDNPGARVWACDFSPAAVAHVGEAAAAAGHPDRCVPFVWDPATQPLPPPSAGVPEGSADAVLLVFTLSAVPPERAAHTMAAAARLLAPGGRLLLRDYGLYDLAMLRFPPEQRLGDLLYMRSDGTLSRFLSVEAAEALAQEAGLVTEEAEYHTISLQNRRKRKEMRRVFVHGKFRKEGGGQ